MSETDQAQFNGWARVEVMGHQTHIGLVTTAAFGDAVFFRVDQPEIPETEETLERPEYGTGLTRIPAGTIVKRGAIPGVTAIVAAKAIYRIIPCTEEAALKAIRDSERRPFMVVRLPESKAVAAPEPGDFVQGEILGFSKVGSPDDVPPSFMDPDEDDEDDDAG